MSALRQAAAGEARFITLEGGEGAGKSTQARRLAEQLKAGGRRVLATREPGGTPRAEAIREALLAGRAKRYGAIGEAVLFNVARESHLELAIRPALKRGEWVVCDRFADSTRAYQGAGGGVSLATLAALERAVIGPTRPDLTLIFDLSPEIGLARAAARRRGTAGDRYETQPLAFHRALQREFRAIAAAEPWRCVLIDAGADEAAVADSVWQAVRQRLGG